MCICAVGVCAVLCAVLFGMRAVCAVCLVRCAECGMCFYQTILKTTTDAKHYVHKVPCVSFRHEHVQVMNHIRIGFHISKVRHE